jgi:Protein of unknown function (DUF2970)
VNDLAPRKSRLLATFKAVGASFFGVRSSKDHESDLTTLNPIQVILVGVVLAAVFVVILLTIVKFVLR